jgi:C4-dicarboxylate-binding protein DctP
MPTTAEAKPIQMRILYAYPDTTQHGMNMHHFKALADKYLAGKVEVKLYGNAMVCPINKEPTTVLSGGAEAFYSVTNILETMDPAEAIYMIPYLWATGPGNTKHIRKGFASPQIEGVLRERQKKLGFYRLGSICTAEGFTYFSNPRPLKNPDDFKGLRMRHPGGLNGSRMFELLGAIPVSVPGTEVPIALQSNVIDGLTTTPLHWFDARWLTKHATLPYWAAYSLPFVVNLKWWNNLPADIRDVIENKIMPEVQEFGYKALEEKTPATLKKASQPPFNVQVYTMTKAEQKKMRDLLQQPCVDAFRKAIGPEVADPMIKAVRDLMPAEFALD